jgi:hypothetical protein
MFSAASLPSRSKCLCRAPEQPLLYCLTIEGLAFASARLWPGTSAANACVAISLCMHRNAWETIELR